SSEDESDSEDGEGDTEDASVSEDGEANVEDIVDEEHIVDEVEEDVPENARNKALRKLRKKVASPSIRNNFYVGKEFAKRDAVKERIKAYSVESPKDNIYEKGKAVIEETQEDKT
ncbi:hypothetical protein Tco_1010010, partial [Tanacetum coccineum]